jgi:hypothetical protein
MPAWNKGVIGRVASQQAAYGAHDAAVDLPNKPDPSSMIQHKKNIEKELQPSAAVLTRQNTRRKRSSLNQHAIVGLGTTFAEYQAQDPLREPKNLLQVVPRRLEPMLDVEPPLAEKVLAPPANEEKVTALNKYVNFREKKGISDSVSKQNKKFLATKIAPDKLAKRRMRLLGDLSETFKRKDPRRDNPFFSAPTKLNFSGRPTEGDRKSSWSRKLPTLKPDKTTNRLYLVFPKYGSIQEQNSRYFSAASSLCAHGPGT